MSDSILIRLRHHAKDERNTAFARSTMREAIDELARVTAQRDCKCDFRTHMLGDGCEVCNPAKELEYTKDIIAVQDAEIERLNSCLRYEQHRAERIGTCGPGCETWGPAHYECAVQEVKKLQHTLADRDEALEKNLATIVHLSGRLAASREREARIRAIAESAIKTRSRDVSDWADDMRMIAALAEGAQG